MYRPREGHAELFKPQIFNPAARRRPQAVCYFVEFY